MSLEVGKIVGGKYRIVRPMARGGMGAVYEGMHERIRRKVAIKVLHGELVTDPTLVVRFEREAQASATIGSPHIVEVLDLGELDGGERYMVMEFLEGETLQMRLRGTEKLSPSEMLPIAIQMLDGLAAAHDAGIIHRDLKPANIFLVDEPDHRGRFVKILDFGISKFRRLDDGDTTTRPGTLLGTPNYMPPEQAASKPIDQRADIYSVGAVLYRGLLGRRPFFECDGIEQLVVKLVLHGVGKLDAIDPDVDPELAAMIERAMSLSPVDRYPDAASFADALREWLVARDMTPPPRASRRGARHADESPSGPGKTSDSGGLRIVDSSSGVRRSGTTEHDGPLVESPTLLTPSPTLQRLSLTATGRSRRAAVGVVAALALVAGMVWLLAKNAGSAAIAPASTMTDADRDEAPPRPKHNATPSEERIPSAKPTSTLVAATSAPAHDRGRNAKPPSQIAVAPKPVATASAVASPAPKGRVLRDDLR